MATLTRYDQPTVLRLVSVQPELHSLDSFHTVLFLSIQEQPRASDIRLEPDINPLYPRFGTYELQPRSSRNSNFINSVEASSSLSSVPLKFETSRSASEAHKNPILEMVSCPRAPSS